MSHEEPLGGYKFIHEDGLLVMGLALFTFGLSIVAEATLIGLIIAILLIPVGETAKRAVTMTRLTTSTAIQLAG